jgi:hypothetical protein
MAPNTRNNNNNGHLFTLFVLFVAVLLAYRQRNVAVDAVNRASEAFSSATADHPSATHTATPSPSRTGTPVRRQLPQHVLAFLSQLPAMLLPMVTYPFYITMAILPYLIYPLHLVLQAVLTILSPLILLLQETYRILILLPMNFVLSIGRTLYPFYLFGAVAVLFGALMGSCGGVVHRALVSKALKPVGDEWKEEVHSGVVRVVDGKSGLRQERRRAHREDYDRDRHPVKEEDLRGWRDSVW